MKRVLLLLQLLMLSVAAFAQKPIYVYFNDGTFKAFLSSQVDRIAVAHADDVPDSDNYVQEVWTPDSVYRYPVASIDSIGSYMPPTKFKSGAIDLSEDLFDYVVSADTTHIFLQPDTPDNLIPRKGQKLGYPTIESLPSRSTSSSLQV